MPLILSKQGFFELEVKKSRFTGHCIYAETEQNAKTFINEIRNIHKDANHNVFAYSVPGGENISVVTRMSDDGEPSGTAGMPVLNVYQKSGIINFVCVVTRYFGGTLLGAGGLVRAYTKTAKGAMENACPEELIIKKLFCVTCSYSNHDKVKYNFNKWGLEVNEWEYTDICKTTVYVRKEQEADFLNANFFEFFELRNARSAP